MKITIFGFCLLMLTSMSATAMAAEVSTMDEQRHTLTALYEYIERTFEPVPQPLPHEATQRILREGTSWLVGTQEASGRFTYEYDPYRDAYPAGDNIVRQAGALFQLGEVARANTDVVPGLAETIESSIAYFESLSHEDEFLGVSFRCIVEGEGSKRCKLGATSLAVIGVLSYIEAYPEKAAQYEALVEDYLNYITVSKNLDGGFRNYHHVGEKSQPNFESPFSTGEAVLALTRYHLLTNSSSAKVMAENTIAYLSGEEFDSALYLWMMAALKDLESVETNPLHVAYAKDFTAWRVDRVKRFKNTRKNYCAYAEGIASAYSVLAPTMSEAEREALRSELDFWNAKNARLQVTNPYRFVREDNELTMLEAADFRVAEGGFLTGHDERTQRIDFTQHCLSAYLQTLVDIDGYNL